ncbi:MAG: PilZ domain-containing protein [Deltaproteobacteria bacterium]|nr:PilZ domain-containing protein [Deltaproteobacteria bacterium]
MHKPQERRSALRVETQGGEAICHVQGYGEHYVMDDLSKAGAHFRLGPMISVGTPIQVVLFAGTLGMVSVDAKVVRHELDGTGFGVAFDAMDDSDEEQIEDIVVEILLDEFMN